MLLCPWDSPGKNTGVGSRAIPEGNLPELGIEPMSLTSPALAGRFFTSYATWEAHKNTRVGYHSLLQGDHSDTGSEHSSPSLACGFFTDEPPGKPHTSF